MAERHVFMDELRGDGSRLYSAAYFDGDGALVLETHDLGPVVEAAFGMSEYEAVERYSVEQTERLRRSLGEDLLAAIGERWPDSPRGLREHAVSLGIGRGVLWTWIGD